MANAIESTNISNPNGPLSAPAPNEPLIAPVPNEPSLEEIERQKIVHKTNFDQWLATTQMDTKSTSKIVPRALADSIIRVLTNIDKPTANFKQRIKKMKYNIILEDETGNSILHKIHTTKNHTNNLPVAIKENFFDILYSLHSVQRGHTGICKTVEDIRIRYYGIYCLKL